MTLQILLCLTPDDLLVKWRPQVLRQMQFAYSFKRLSTSLHINQLNHFSSLSPILSNRCVHLCEFSPRLYLTCTSPSSHESYSVFTSNNQWDLLAHLPSFLPRVIVSFLMTTGGLLSLVKTSWPQGLFSDTVHSMVELTLTEMKQALM